MALVDEFDFKSSKSCFDMEDDFDDDKIDGFGLPDFNGDGKGDFWDIVFLALQDLRLPAEWRAGETSVTYDRAENVLTVKASSHATGESYTGSWNSETENWGVLTF